MSADHMPASALKFRAEIGAESPLWTSSGEMVDLDGTNASLRVQLPRPLQDHLSAWAHDASLEAGREAEGRRLLRHLQAHLGGGITVFWDIDTDASYDPFVTW